MAIRSKLHINKLEDFKNWLICKSWTIQQPKGEYEVIRATKDKRIFIAYKKLDAKEHFSIQDKDIGIIHSYLRDRHNIGKNNLMN